MLVTAFRSPATAAAFTASIPESTFPACYFASHSPLPLPVRPFRIRYPNRFAPVGAASSLLARCSFHSSLRAAPPASTPLWDFCLPPDQRVLLVWLPLDPPSESARSPIAPRCRFLSLVFRQRIVVPGPLRPRRLAVPQTSWNLFHYVPDCALRQFICEPIDPFSSDICDRISNELQGSAVNRLCIKRESASLFSGA